MEKSLDFYLKYQLFYDPTLMTSNTTSTKSLRFKPGGHSRVLARSIRLPREDFIVLKELDLDDDRVLNMVLTNIKEGNNKGLFLTNTGYRGKYPKKWFNFLYPHELDPILIGILDLADILMGWMSLSELTPA